MQPPNTIYSGLFWNDGLQKSLWVLFCLKQCLIMVKALTFWKLWWSF